MTAVPAGRPGGTRIGRFRLMDAQRVNLDGFAVEDAALGLIAFDSPDDPAPSLVVRDGRVVVLDGRAEDDFDVVDEFVARHGLDLSVADEAMGLPDVGLARMLVDPAVARDAVVRLVAGTTPAKLARVLATLRPVSCRRRAVRRCEPGARPPTRRT